MSGKKKEQRGAVMQFECEWERVKCYSTKSGLESPKDRIYHIAHCAAWDTIQNGGTFVLVAGNGKITMVQRPDAEDLDDPAQQTPRA